MADLEGFEEKYFVIKRSDVEEHLHPYVQEHFYRILHALNEVRDAMGKKENTYLVINTDEPYAHEVIEILKRHGHWG